MVDGERPRTARREATTEAMLDGAQKLFAERGFTGVSVRDIAEAAGVSHALVHRYLGTKEEIYRSVLARNDGDIVDAARGRATCAVPFRSCSGTASCNTRTISVSSYPPRLQGMPFSVTEGNFPATKRLVELAENEAAGRPHDPSRPPPRFAVAAIVALDVGWAAMEKWLVEVAGLGDVDRETLIGWLEQVALCIVDGMLPGDGPLTSCRTAACILRASGAVLARHARSGYPDSLAGRPHEPAGLEGGQE